MLAWTFFEYLAHRYIAHFMDRVCQHHQLPYDYSKVQAPLIIPVIILLALFWWGSVTVGLTTFAAGFTVGYFVYAVVHYFCHHQLSVDFWLLRKLRAHHNIHHFRDDHSNYGVTSPLWDWVFGTLKGKQWLR